MPFDGTVETVRPRGKEEMLGAEAAVTIPEIKPVSDTATAEEQGRAEKEAQAIIERMKEGSGAYVEPTVEAEASAKLPEKRAWWKVW